MVLRLKTGILAFGFMVLVVVGVVMAQPALSTPHSPTAITIAECGVYPQTFHESYLDQKVPLHYAYWDLHASELLKPAYAQSQVRVSMTDWNQSFLGWLSTSGSSNELDTAYMNDGLLGHGFDEAPPPPEDPIAPGQINHQLEVGDWMYGLSVRPNTTILSYHIDVKTKFLLPLHDTIWATGSIPKYRYSQLIAVRLLDYKFGGADRYMTFALLDLSPRYACFQFDDQATVNQSVSFTPLMPFIPNDPDLRWDFGDGTTAPISTTTHTYTQTGTYQVSLTYYLDPITFKPFEQAIGTINVSPVVTPTFTPTPTTTPTPTLTPEPTVTPTVTPTLTLTPEPSQTPTLTPEPSQTPTLTPEPSHTPTLIPEPTVVPRWTVWIPSLRHDQ